MVWELEDGCKREGERERDLKRDSFDLGIQGAELSGIVSIYTRAESKCNI